MMQVPDPNTPSRHSSPRKSRAQVIGDDTEEDDPIEEETLQSPSKKSKYETFSTPSPSKLHSSPVLKSTPSTPADDLAAPLLSMIEALPALLEKELDGPRREIARMARLQLAHSKQAEYKDKALKAAKDEIKTLQHRIRVLEEENQALKEL